MADKFSSKNSLRHSKESLLSYKTLSELFRYLFISWRYDLLKFSINFGVKPLKPKPSLG